MVKKSRKGAKTSIKADVIVLGCTLPGIVTANKLKKKFGDSMDIVVLDLSTPKGVISKCNVAFKKDDIDSESDSDISENDRKSYSHIKERTNKDYLYSVARHYLIKYANDYKIPIPGPLLNPAEHRSSLKKLFQYRDGSTVTCTNFFNDFDYLNMVEKFELNQYQKSLDTNMKHLFQANKFADLLNERSRLLYYDQTTMEKNICDSLLFPTSREIMRTTVELVCGAPAHTVSLLFYLHQCYRTSGTKHHLDGQNTRLREKVLGYCRKRMSHQLEEDISEIILPAKPIRFIRPNSNSDVEQVILETTRGDTTYICGSLAMALKPDQLQTIQVDNELLPENEAMIIKNMIPGKTKKFVIHYEVNFWENQGYSGDILSMRGPIIWAMMRPSLSFTGSVEKYAALIGYLMVKDDEYEVNSQAAVVEQLVNLFGLEASSPVMYKETLIADIFVPQCGDYVGLQSLSAAVNRKGVEWGAVDYFADGDVAASLEAGHTAYLHLLSCLRPQAQTYEDISATDGPTILTDSPFTWWLSQINVVSTMKFTVYTTALIVGVKLIRTYMKR